MFMSVTPIIAQSDFRPGYYITNDLDTVFGLIDYRGEIRDSRICVTLSRNAPDKAGLPVR